MGDIGMLEDFYAEEADVEILNGDRGGIYNQMLQTLKKRSVMAVQDDYEAWRDFGKQQDMGKVLFVDESDYQTHPIFFEDVENSVDVRDVITGKSIPNEKADNMYVVRVQPQKAIIDGDYFTGQIKIAEELRDEEIERVEQALDT